MQVTLATQPLEDSRVTISEDTLMQAKTNARALQTKAMILPLAKHWPILILGLLAPIVLLWRLGQNALTDWDEAIYAQAAKEMVQSGEWLTPYYGYEPYYRKPPLLIWTTAIFYHSFGINEFWSRAASSFAGILLVIVTYLIGKSIYNRRIGFLAVMTLLSSHEFVKRSRLGMTDIILSLFVFLAIYSYLRLGTNQKWWYPLWASFGLAIMAKSWAAVIPVAAVFITLAVHRNAKAALGSRHFWQGLILAFAIVAPWHVLMIVRHGPEFIDEYVIRHLFARTSTALAGHVGGPLYYADVLQSGFSPWFYLLPFAVALAIRDNINELSSSCILLVLVMVVLGTYSFAVKTKLAWYIVPVYPAFAILVGATVSEAFRRHPSLALGGLIFAALVSTLIAPTRLLYLLAFFALLMVAAYRLRVTTARQTHQLAVILMSVFLTGIGTTSLIQFNNRIPSAPVYGAVKAPDIEIARIAASASLDHREPLIGLALEGDPLTLEDPTILFYSDRPVQMAWMLDELAELTSSQERKEILLAKKHVESLSTEYEIHILAEVEPFVYATIRRR